MKRTRSLVLFIISSLILLVSIFFCIYGVVDIIRTQNELANAPSASGIDYWGIGWGYGISLFAISVLGLILSWISRKLLQQKILRTISVIAIAVFVFLIIASLFMFYA